MGASLDMESIGHERVPACSIVCAPLMPAGSRREFRLAILPALSNVESLNGDGVPQNRSNELMTPTAKRRGGDVHDPPAARVFLCAIGPGRERLWKISGFSRLCGWRSR